MAQLVNDAFTGGTLGGQWITDHANDGGHAVSGGAVTLSITTTPSSRARIRTAAETMADGDTLEVEVTSGTNFFAFVVMRDDTDSAAFQPGLWIYGDSWQTCMVRDAAGAIQYASGPTIASRPRARMRRDANTLVCETWNGTDWSESFGTLSPSTGGGLWSPSWSTARAEFLVRDFGGSGAGSMVIAQVGDGDVGGGASGFFRRRRMMV